VSADAATFEEAVQPEPIVAGLITGDHLHWLGELSGNACNNPFDQLEKCVHVVTLQRVTADLGREWGVDCHNPALLA